MKKSNYQQKIIIGYAAAECYCGMRNWASQSVERQAQTHINPSWFDAVGKAENLRNCTTSFAQVACIVLHGKLSLTVSAIGNLSIFFLHRAIRIQFMVELWTAEEISEQKQCRNFIERELFFPQPDFYKLSELNYATAAAAQLHFFSSASCSCAFLLCHENGKIVVLFK